MAPAFFTGEVKSCWTSLDLLQIILQLQVQSEAALSLHRLRIKTAMDVTVLMVALVQLKSVWTEPRFKMMAWGPPSEDNDLDEASRPTALTHLLHAIVLCDFSQGDFGMCAACLLLQY